ncbi:uncharacterized protein LOC126905236 [Daktulosphaira vitifoliae]|uniref:uncharacterized protein LOC126905236 n=1 Tax=Daktulosphaira vitifoliae TaxID=58002 RepID=UPI0021AAA466|nr:uncharacterized protein LOC126905236 [Daktulosphaira vitifoliae]
MNFLDIVLVHLAVSAITVHSLEVKKIYVIERDGKTGLLRGRRQNLPITHTVARIGGQADQFNGPSGAQPLDLASTVDLTVDRMPTDYLTPPNVEFTFQNFQTEHLKPQESQQQSVGGPQLVSAIQPQIVQATSPFTPNSALSQPVLQNPQLVQTPASSNQVQSLTFASQPIEQFTPFTPTLTHDHQQSQQQNNGRWELGFDANEILTPPVSGGPDVVGASPHFSSNPHELQLESHQLRNFKSPPFGFLGFDGAPSASNTKFTTQDAVVRQAPSNNNIYWGTPKAAQQPLRPSSIFGEPNTYRFNSHHHLNDGFHVPFTGQFDNPLSQGTVSDHVVHTSFRIKRQLDFNSKEDNVDKRETRQSGDAKEEGEIKEEPMPVFSFVKTDKQGNFKWSVRQGY